MYLNEKLPASNANNNYNYKFDFFCFCCNSNQQGFESEMSKLPKLIKFPHNSR